MLSREENELLTRTDPGTPMGEVMRRYWMPILLERELPEPDCPPVRVQLLGEKLVAFRDSAGRIGLLDEFCPHRLVSLWLGRNENHGLRCVYHGWKYDVDGTCLEQMNEPEPFCDKIKIKHYPTVEMGGVVWAYLGPPEKQPPPPAFEWTQAAPSHRHVSKVIEECNWLQAFEGGIDTSHAPILHRNISSNSTRPGISLSTPFVRGGAPILEVDITDYGYRYFGVRPLDDDKTYVRGYHYIMPFTQLRPAQMARDGSDRFVCNIPGHFWVPMDDRTCMVWNFLYSYGDEPLTEDQRQEYGNGNGPDHVDQQTFRSIRNARNNWMIDRQVQKTDTFTGIEGINAQDRAVQESMGSIVPRWNEHLGPADRAVITARRLLLEAVKAVQAGESPRGADDSYYRVRAVEHVYPQEVSWREELLPEMHPAERELAGVR